MNELRMEKGRDGKYRWDRGKIPAALIFRKAGERGWHADNIKLLADTMGRQAKLQGHPERERLVMRSDSKKALRSAVCCDAGKITGKITAGLAVASVALSVFGLLDALPAGAKSYFESFAKYPLPTLVISGAAYVAGVALGLRSRFKLAKVEIMAERHSLALHNVVQEIKGTFIP